MSSSRPSAFDALMSNARASAKKKTTPQASNSSPSPNKRKISKTQDADSPKAEAFSDSPKPRSDSPSIAEDLKKGAKTQDADLTKVEAFSDSAKPRSSIAKKSRTLSQTDKVDELKSRIVLLKRKPGEFDPERVACWEKGERVPFLFVALAFDLVSAESGRIVITDILCNMLRTVIATTPDDLVAAVYLAANEIAPAHEGVELGIGEGSIIKAISEAFGRTEAQVKKLNTVCC